MGLSRLLSFALLLPALVAALPSLAAERSYGETLLARRRAQYRSILTPPQETGFDPSAWIARLENPKAKMSDMSAIEDLLDARSRLYGAAERARDVLTGSVSGPSDSAAIGRLIADGYRALSAMDFDAATNACEELEKRMAHFGEMRPRGADGSALSAHVAEMRFHSPFGWVKSFTQWGYAGAPDGGSVSEPTPWLILWNDGFRFDVAQDPRVVIATRSSSIAPHFREPRFTAPMTDVHFERNAFETRWILPDRTVTFSLLTPVIDVDGVETLVLSGFATEPLRLRWTGPNGVTTGVDLVHVPKEESEIVPSALMDFSAPPPPPRRWSRGEQKIDPAKVAGPYLRLRGATWSLALFPSARPVSAKWEKGSLAIRFERKGRVGILRLRDNIDYTEQAELCEFFARAYLAYPTSCRETSDGRTFAWDYGYRSATNAWGTVPRVVAPVPPLLDYAGVSVPKSFARNYHTKWGVCRFCEGTRVACAAPAETPRDVPRRGVSVRLTDPDPVWEGHVTNGAQWARVYFSGQGSLSEHCARLEDRLAKYGKRLPFLIDPHCYDYQVNWGKGIPGEEGTARFVALWDAISKVGAKHPDAVAGYDLYNEPGCCEGSEEIWRRVNERAVKAIHANHPGAKVYYSAVYGGNPNGLNNLVPLPPECGPQVATFHFYSPHAFTHQRPPPARGSTDACVYYPAWSARMVWQKEKADAASVAPTVQWYDRWTLDALLLPAHEHYARHRVPLHVGEFGVIGYANRRSSRSAFLWTRDTVELIESLGASWHIWDNGFGLGNRYVREYVYGLWKPPIR